MRRRSAKFGAYDDLCLSIGLVLWLLSDPAWASIVLTSGVGGGAGALQKASEKLIMQGYGYQFEASWNPSSKGKNSAFSLGLVGKQYKLFYEENEVSKRATYNLFGPNLSYVLSGSETFHIQMQIGYFSMANFTSLSSHSVRLNGSNFKYSTWQQYSGQAAMEGRINFASDSITGQFSKTNRFRSGLGIFFIQQAYTKEKTEITTSNDEVSPDTTVSQEAVSYSLSLVGLDLFIGLSF